MTHSQRIILFVFLGLCALGLFGWYLYHQTERIFRGPEIVITEPVSGATISEPVVSIRGTTKNLQTLSLNGLTITVNEAGVFSEVRPLLPGLNVWKIIGTDRFGRIQEEKIELFHPK